MNTLSVIIAPSRQKGNIMKRFVWSLASLLLFLILTISSFASPVIEIDIDIKPGSDPNCFNNDGNGVISVAILGSASFDVTQVDAATVQLAGMEVKAVGKSNKLLASIEDVNNDGFNDLVVKIEDKDGVFSAGDTTATVSGNLSPAFGSTAFQGTDTICIVGNAAPALNPRSKLTTTWARMKAKR